MTAFRLEVDTVKGLFTLHPSGLETVDGGGGGL